MYKITKQDREKLEDRVRARLLNGLSGVKNATLVGTRSDEGLCNVTVFSSIFHLGANPALMGMVFRPRESHTLKNIRSNQIFTLNHLSHKFSQKIHFTSARFEKNEFEACGLSEEFLGDFHAPFVKEASIKWSMKMIRIIEIPENGTHLMIAEVQDIYLENKKLIREDGSLSLEGRTCGVVGLDSYFKISDEVRYSYAKPNEGPVIL